VNHYARGRAHEYAVRDALEAEGFWCARAAGSKGKADIVALRAGERPVLVQVKAGGPQVSPAEREALYGAAVLAGALPVVAHKPFRAEITYRELTGFGPKDWVPWSPL
jgi:Holliday junction resolvase